MPRIYILKLSDSAPSPERWVGRLKGPFSSMAEAFAAVPEAFDLRKQFGYVVVKEV